MLNISTFDLNLHQKIVTPQVENNNIKILIQKYCLKYAIQNKCT